MKEDEGDRIRNMLLPARKSCDANGPITGTGIWLKR